MLSSLVLAPVVEKGTGESVYLSSALATNMFSFI